MHAVRSTRTPWSSRRRSCRGRPMHSSPPLEPHPVKSYYYVTDAQADWPAERQDAWLQKFNVATLADISAHEVAPGHYVHSLFMRRTPGKIRRIWIGLNPF